MEEEAIPMLRLLERTIDSLNERLVLLAPPIEVPSFFRDVDANSVRHHMLKREMQKLRGSIYLDDGALQREQLSSDGLHETPEDDRSWHLLTVDSRERVTGCAWYLEHRGPVSVADLRVRHCPLAKMKDWRDTLWNGVESELTRAGKQYLRYAEVGGWAVAQESRCTSEGLLLALAGYSLGQIGGGCLGITTATVRHCSSSILRRLGGSPLEVGGAVIPSYYDPNYGCEMEILRFDSRRPSAKYAGLIDLLRQKMAGVTVVAHSAAAPALAEPITPDAFALWSPAMAV
jgi:hypothetical protein